MPNVDWGIVLQQLGQGVIQGLDIKQKKEELALKAKQLEDERMKNLKDLVNAAVPATPETTIPTTTPGLTSTPWQTAQNPAPQRIPMPGQIPDYSKAPSAPIVPMPPTTDTATLPGTPGKAQTPLTPEQQQAYLNTGKLGEGVISKTTPKPEKGVYKVKLVDVSGRKPDRTVGDYVGYSDRIVPYNSSTGATGDDELRQELTAFAGILNNPMSLMSLSDEDRANYTETMNTIALHLAKKNKVPGKKEEAGKATTKDVPSFPGTAVGQVAKNPKTGASYTWDGKKWN